MAKPALSNLAPVPEPTQGDPAPIKRIYEFPTIVFDVDPDDEPPAPRTVVPWVTRLGDISAEVLADPLHKTRAFYVPCSYYVDERKIAADKVTHTYVSQKIQDAIKTWTKANPTVSAGFIIKKAPRQGTEDGYQEAGPGILVFLKKLA